jgi:hypothetical protein
MFLSAFGPERYEITFADKKIRANLHLTNPRDMR